MKRRGLLGAVAVGLGAMAGGVTLRGLAAAPSGALSSPGAGSVEDSGPPLKVCVIGVGTAGRKLVNECARRPALAARHLAIDTASDDYRSDAAKRCVADSPGLEEALVLTFQPLLGPNGRGVWNLWREEKEGLLRAAAPKIERRAERMLAGASHVVVFAGMAGATGAGLAPVVCRAAMQAGATVLCVAIQPFCFEGPARLECARANTRILEALGAQVWRVEGGKVLQKLRRQGVETPTLLQAYTEFNRIIVDEVGQYQQSLIFGPAGRSYTL